MDIQATITLDASQALALVAYHLKVDPADVEIDYEDSADEPTITIRTTSSEVRKLTRKIEKAVEAADAADAQLARPTETASADGSDSLPSQDAT